MKRIYDDITSKRNGAGRGDRISIQRRTIVILSIIFVSVCILLGSSIKAFAGAANQKVPVYKYYTDIEVQPGDTLWGIAQEYTKGTDVKVQDYIDEVCLLNHISEDEIHAGGHLVISYYSTELK